MRRQIATLQFNGVIYKVIEDKGAKANPYRVLAQYNELTDHGVYHRHKQIERYADLASAMAILAIIVRGDFGFDDLMEYIG